MAKFSALLDACTLVPVSLADTFLSLAEAGLYRPLWSDRILEETQLAVKRIHPELSPESVERRIAVMRDFFDDAAESSLLVGVLRNGGRAGFRLGGRAGPLALLGPAAGLLIRST
ncbi:hypothetical protein ACUY24_07215, partial [Corynebacterium simulans]